MTIDAMEYRNKDTELVVSYDKFDDGIKIKTSTDYVFINMKEVNWLRDVLYDIEWNHNQSEKGEEAKG